MSGGSASEPFPKTSGALLTDLTSLRGARTARSVEGSDEHHHDGTQRQRGVPCRRPPSAAAPPAPSRACPAPRAARSRRLLLCATLRLSSCLPWEPRRGHPRVLFLPRHWPCQRRVSLSPSTRVCRRRSVPADGSPCTTTPTRASTNRGGGRGASTPRPSIGTRGRRPPCARLTPAGSHRCRARRR